ncbi:Dor1-like family-domain-containing protein [Panaeolus papilionaceus]|nr:Dor1-like family-domain-containing protein [Panaeolus papilionaceus]
MDDSSFTDRLTDDIQKTSKLEDVTFLSEIIASSSKIPLEHLSSHNSQNYLGDLTNHSLQELLDEPASLQTQSHHLTSSLTSLTHTSYPTFLSLHQTTNALSTSLSSLSSSLDALLTSSLPALEESATSWKDRTDNVLKERNKARVVLEQHEKIRDLLDIPLLIDTCVRNGYFSEALSLISHAKSLAAHATASSKHPPSILASVLSEVHHSVMQMLLSLLTTLYEPNRKLPALWKAVNFLRKMDVFGPSSPFASVPSPIVSETKLADSTSHPISSEEQIALAFLVGREVCLKTTLESSRNDVLRMTRHGELEEREKEDLALYLKKYIDMWRECVYDVITQYSTIFLEKSSSTSSTSPNNKSTSPTSLTNPSKSATSIAEYPQQFSHLFKLITTHASRALTTHLIPVLVPSLPLLSLPLLHSLLTQLTYCSTAFARVGLEFRTLLSELFSSTVADVVGRDLKIAGDKFVARFAKPPTSLEASSKAARDLVTKTLISPSSASSPPVPPSPSPATPSSATAALSGGGFGSNSPPHIPPQIIASYPPLAEHINALLTVLNNLRLLAPTNILHPLTRILDDEVLARGGRALHTYIKALLDVIRQGKARADVTQSQLDSEMPTMDVKTILVSLGQVYFVILVPFMRRALVEGVYGAKLDHEFSGGGENLPNVVMDWEDWILEAEESSSDGSTMSQGDGSGGDEETD